MHWGEVINGNSIQEVDKTYVEAASESKKIWCDAIVAPDVEGRAIVYEAIVAE